MKTIKEIVAHIAKKEAKKSQVTVGNIREIVGIISDLCYKSEEVRDTIIINGHRRAKKK